MSTWTRGFNMTDAIRRLLRSPQGLAGCIVILLMLLLVVFGAHLAPYDYTKISLLERYKPPSLAHWFGTDNFGRDVLSRVMVGARATILSALAATALATIARSEEHTSELQSLMRI